MNDSGTKQKPKDAGATWFGNFARLDQLDWLTIVLAVLAGTLAKQHHFLDFPDWFLDWAFPFLLIIAGYKMRRVLESRRKGETSGSEE